MGAKWLQDGDPRQNSKAAQKSWKELGCTMFSITARSPDLNPIENMFHIVRRQLKDDALEKKIQKETYKEFYARVKDTILSTFAEFIDKTISSLPKRIKAVIQHKGGKNQVLNFFIVLCFVCF